MDTFSKLLAVVEHLETVDSEWSEWFISAVNISLESSQTLDQALGIRGMRYAHLKQQRDEHIYKAWQKLPDHLSPWRRSSMLAELIYRFESRCWPRLRHKEEVPEHLSQIEVLIFKALQTGLKLPSTPRQLHNIVWRNLKCVHIS